MQIKIQMTNRFQTARDSFFNIRWGKNLLDPNPEPYQPPANLLNMEGHDAFMWLRGFSRAQDVTEYEAFTLADKLINRAYEDENIQIHDYTIKEKTVNENQATVPRHEDTPTFAREPKMRFLKTEERDNYTPLMQKLNAKGYDIVYNPRTGSYVVIEQDLIFLRDFSSLENIHPDSFSEIPEDKEDTAY